MWDKTVDVSIIDAWMAVKYGIERPAFTDRAAELARRIWPYLDHETQVALKRDVAVLHRTSPSAGDHAWDWIFTDEGAHINIRRPVNGA